jgi:hypothetical protein
VSLCCISLCWVSFYLVPLCRVSHHLIVMLNVIMLSAVVLRVVLLNAILLNVVAPIFFQFFTNFLFSFSEPPSLRETGADLQTPRRWRRRRATENAAIRWGIRTGDPRSEPPAAKWDKMNAGNANRGGRLSTIDLLFIVVGRFVKR